MGARRLDRSSALPLWSQMQDDLLRRVRAGEFDAAFPPEMALVAEYEVSRHTVRQSLAQLRADGVVVAERGRAPRVAAPDALPRIDQQIGAPSSLLHSVEDAGLTQSSAVRALERVADGIVATRLDLEESTPLLYLERVRHAGDEPLAWDRVWLPFAEAEALVGVDLTRTALYDELAARTGLRVDGGRERVHATTATAHQARLLGVEPGAALLGTERLGCSRGRPVEWRVTLARGDRLSLSAPFGTSAGEQRVNGNTP